MHYFIYQTTNTVNGKIYVGVHQTEDLNDGYLGSGKYLWRAIRKHGKNAFTRTVLESFANRTDAEVREAQIVNADFIARDDTYNMAIGGSGGSIDINRKPFTRKHTPESKQKMSRALTGKKRSDDVKRHLAETNWAHHRSDEQREHAKHAGHLSQIARRATPEKQQEISRKTGDSLKRHFAENGSAVTGITRLRVVCPHCNKTGANNTMTRWHFDKCRNKIDGAVSVKV